MKTLLNRLTILLAIQGVLIVIVYWGGSGFGEPSERRQFLEFESEQVNRLVIQGNSGEQEVTLKQIEGNWMLPYDFPADSSRINSLLERLQKLERAVSVATTEAARVRFEVAEENFSRRVELYDGNTLLDALYLGTGAGARRAHIRRDGEPQIYSLPIASYDLPVKSSSWEDKTVLQLPEATFHKIESGPLVLRKTGTSGAEKAAETGADGSQASSSSPTEPSKWLAEGLDPKESLNVENLETGINLLKNLRFSRVLPAVSPDSPVFDSPALEVKVFWNKDQSRRLVIGKREEPETEYQLQVSDRKEVFRLSDSYATRLIDTLSPDGLVVDEEAKAKSPESSGGDTSSSGESLKPGGGNPSKDKKN